MEKNPRKSYGAFAATVAKKLKKSGLTGKALELALEAVKVGSSPASALKVPRKVVKTLGVMLARERRAVVVAGKTGKLKVYSFDGFAGAQRHAVAIGKKHQPWDRTKKKGASGAEGAA